MLCIAIGSGCIRSKSVFCATGRPESCMVIGVPGNLGYRLSIVPGYSWFVEDGAPQPWIVFGKTFKILNAMYDCGKDSLKTPWATSLKLWNIQTLKGSHEVAMVVESLSAGIDCVITIKIDEETTVVDPIVENAEAVEQR
eukprot:Gb_13417 [translate_table: standard]